MSSDLLSKCRTCLSAGHNNYHQLFDYVEENYKILEMLDGIVPQIDIKTTSQFSSLVCQPCVDKLLTGYKFQQLCIETNNRLHDLLGIAVFETEPKLEKILDPLTGDGDTSFKMKQEIEEDACFECEIQPDEMEGPIASDNDNDWGPGGGGSDSDSSNEKLSVLKQRSAKKSPLKVEHFEKPRKLNRFKGSFPCSECGKEFSSLNRLKQHTAIHEKKRAYSCKICHTSFIGEKPFKVHMLTHTNGEVANNEEGAGEQTNSIENNDSKNEFESQEFIEETTATEKNVADNEKEECIDSKDMLTFKCPDCPKCFEKKASLSAHYKVHKKKDFIKNNKCKKIEPEMLEKEDENVCNIVGEDANNVDDKVTKVMVKEEIEITPQIFEEPMDGDFEASAEWFNNDYEDSDDNSDKDLFGKHETKETKNIDFVDTGIGEIEKPNSSNKRSGSFPCEMCGKVFDRPYRLKRHSSVHSLTRPHECEICKYRFATVNILKAHLFQHENETGGNFNSQSRPEGFKCPDCPRRFEKQASLSAHRQIHTRNASEANYPCMVCQRNFMSVRSLTEHITNKHPEVEKHKCDQCDKTFVLHAHLVEHLNRHKGNKNLVCLICEKEFGYTNTLKEHMRTHSGESPYLCPQCGKTFRSASNLRQHMERHTGLKKYQCPECPSRFNCRSDLIKHASTHSNAKPHVCDICGSRFTRAYSLQKHKLLHSGERPFKCDQCSMTFAIIYHLRRHMRTHTGEKPYKCKYCERAYAESGDLTKHLRTHVGENTYMCDQCPMAFKYQAELRQHQSQHYKMAQKLLQQAQKMSEEAQQHEITEQTQPDQQHLQQTQPQQHEQHQPIQEHQHNQQLLKTDQIQHLPIGITSYQQIPLIDHRQQLNTIVEQQQHHAKIEDVAVARQQQQDNLDINNLSNLYPHKTCLTCLCKSTEAQTLNHILLDNLKILEILYKIVPILSESQEITLPEWICTQCLDKLVVAYTFQKQCLDSVQSLYDLWTKNPTQKESDEHDVYKQEVELEDKEDLSDDEYKIKSLNENKDFAEIQFEEITMQSLPETKEDLEIPFYQSDDEEDSLNDELESKENGSESPLTLQQTTQSENIDELKNDLLQSNESVPCKVCKKIYKNPQGLALHETKAHYKDCPYKCDKCDKGFVTEEFYIKHRNRHLGIKAFKCPHCDKAFDVNSTLNQHLISHSKETPHLCTICGKRFNRSGNLQQHMLRHGDEKPFQCSACPKSFKCLTDHISHMRIHDKHKRYECNICGVRLASHTSMKHHKLVHTGEKPFKCDDCDKCFNSITNMRRHHRLHTGEKPYKCEYCEKDFCQSNDLKKHKRHMHKNEIVSEKKEENNVQKQNQQVNLKQESKDVEHNENEDHRKDEETIESLTKIKETTEIPLYQSEGVKENLENNKNGMDNQQQLILLQNTQSENIKEPENESMTTSMKSNQCKLCKKVFKNTHGLAVHNKKTHLKKHLYKCDKCDKGFDSEEFYIKHYNLHLGIKPFQCNQCEKAFESRYCLKQHLISHSKESPYSCTICGNNFRRKSILKQHHQRIHMGEKPHKCRHCIRAFSLESDLKKHTKRVHKNEKGEESSDDNEEQYAQHVELAGNKQYSEEEDTRESLAENKEDVKKEIEKTEASEDTLNDVLDDNENESDNQLLIELKTVPKTAKESHQCKLCKQIFKNPQGLAAHKTKAHLKKYLYNCDKCERGFDSEEFYIKHKNRHLGIKTFKCPQCGKAFDANSTLNQHLISHSKETPHLCTICGKSFNRSGTLRQHILRHGDDKPFQCSFCPKRFKCLSDQIIHLSIHKKEKRYVCKICGVRLATSTSMSHHKLVHSGEKPFECDHCGKCFNSLSNMRSHRRIHTGEKPYSCQYCEKTFRQSNDRNKHARRMHKKEMGLTKSEFSEENEEQKA
ncbi:zinc finger protein 208-like [Calliphora vicina]|uniref:zinc finger protein 208-like n=1 Tax=Calliphora vicina TaxID=7373 RepID=UPI00325AFF1D